MKTILLMYINHGFKLITDKGENKTKKKTIL